MTAAYRSKWTGRDANPVSGSVHGLGRRPGRQAAINLRVLARWNAAQRAAVAVNREREAREQERDARRARAVRAAMQRRDAIVERDS